MSERDLEEVTIQLPSQLVKQINELGLDISQYCENSLRKGGENLPKTTSLGPGNLEFADCEVNGEIVITLPLELVEKAQDVGLDVKKTCESSLRGKVELLEKRDSIPFGTKYSNTGEEDKAQSSYSNNEVLQKQVKERLLEEFEKVCQIDKNLTDATIAKHLRYVGRFLDWFKKHPQKATSKDIREHLSKYEEEGKPGARQRATKSLRVFFRDFMKMDIAEQFEIPRLPKNNVELPRKDELQKFYDSILNDKYKALFLVYASSGLRANEALELTMDNINLEKRMLMPIHDTRTKRAYVSFYNEEAEDKLEDFLPKRETNDERLFQTGHHSVWKSFKRTSERSEVKVTAQLLRKWFCSEMGKLGVPDRYVDAFCGRVPKTVLGKHYTDYSPEKLKEVYDETEIKVLT